MAGKTGTAQASSKLYSFKQESSIPWFLRDHAWFVAFSPEVDAQIAVVALAEHGGHGGSAAAPVVKRIIQRYWDLERTRENVKAPSGPDEPTGPAGLSPAPGARGGGRG